MDILESLWRGNLCPAEHIDHRDKEYWELVGLLARNEQNLRPTLNQTQQEDLEKMQDIWEEMTRISECSAFIAGFRLAMQIMHASM